MQAPFEAAQEPIQFPAAPLLRDELPYRLRQQSLLGELGRIAVQTRDFQRILQLLRNSALRDCRPASPRSWNMNRTKNV
jgi:hypothetical protein